MRRIRVSLLAGLALAALACGEESGGPELPADTVAPRVAALEPAPLAQDVDIAVVITVTFTEPINPATVGPGSFLVSQGLDTVPGTYSFGDSTAGFVPDAPLRTFTSYGVRLSRGIRDPAGNQLARDTAWSFLTGSEFTPVPPR
jgi:hypothetical protein